jgi:prolyl oligopeptidase
VPTISAVNEILALDNGALLYRDVSYTEPAAWFEVAPGQLQSTKTALASTSPVSFSDIEVTREFAPSTNGAKVPLNIIRRKGNQARRHQSNPALWLRWLRPQHVADVRLYSAALV